MPLRCHRACRALEWERKGAQHWQSTEIALQEKDLVPPPDESLPCADEVPSVLMVQQLNIVVNKVKLQFPVGRFA